MLNKLIRHHLDDSIELLRVYGWAKVSSVFVDTDNSEVFKKLHKLNGPQRGKNYREKFGEMLSKVYLDYEGLHFAPKDDVIEYLKFRGIKFTIEKMNNWREGLYKIILDK